MNYKKGELESLFHTTGCRSFTQTLFSATHNLSVHLLLATLSSLPHVPQLPVHFLTYSPKANEVHQAFPGMQMQSFNHEMENQADPTSKL